MITIALTMTFRVGEHELAVEPGRVVVGRAVRDKDMRPQDRTVPPAALKEVFRRFLAFRRPSVTEEDLERFIRSFGPLPLCSCFHPEPIGHLRQNGDRCSGSARVHRVRTYSEWAGELNDLLVVSAAVREFHHRKQHISWSQFLKVQKPSIAERFVRLSKRHEWFSAKPTGVSQVRLQVELSVNWWLAHGGHEIGFAWPKDGAPTTSMEPSDLWGYLGVALAKEITHNRLRQCQGCGIMFDELAATPDGRGAPPKRCKNCRERDPRYPPREASRRWRAKQKK